MMKNSRFEQSSYGGAFRAGGANRGAESEWWNRAVREALNKTDPKNLTIPPSTKKPQIENRPVWMQALVNRAVAVGQLVLPSW